MKKACIISVGNELLSGQNVDTNTSYFSRELLAVNEWYHLAIVYTRETVSFYVNGIEETQEAFAINTPIGTGKIGAYPDPETEGYDGSYFQGTIDDVCVYDQALSDAQIKVLYTDGGWGE